VTASDASAIYERAQVRLSAAADRLGYALGRAGDLLVRRVRERAGQGTDEAEAAAAVEVVAARAEWREAEVEYARARAEWRTAEEAAWATGA